MARQKPDLLARIERLAAGNPMPDDETVRKLNAEIKRLSTELAEVTAERDALARDMNQMRDGYHVAKGDVARLERLVFGGSDEQRG